MMIETELDSPRTIMVPFHCVSCEKDVEAMADPLDILLGGDTMELVCPLCQTGYTTSIFLEENDD